MFSGLAIILCLLTCLNRFYLSIAFSQHLFSGDFRAPQAPGNIPADYQASYVQHKWDATGISHISTGMIYASQKTHHLRMDATYGSVIASSFFDYSKANNDGTVPNYMYTLSPSTAVAGSCAHYNVTPAFPLFSSTTLADYQATFSGLITDDLFYANREPLQAWDILFGGMVSVTFFLDKNNTVVRMDFSSPARSTFTTTRLFNIVPGLPAENLFTNPCPTESPRPTSSSGRRSI